MAKSKAISDEQLIAALLANGTIKAAAAAVGLSERAVYDRMNDGDFKALHGRGYKDCSRDHAGQGQQRRSAIAGRANDPEQRREVRAAAGSGRSADRGTDNK